MLQRLDSDIKAALLSGDKEKARALAFVKSAIQSAAKDQGLEPSDEFAYTIMRKEAKKRQEASDLFKKGGNLEASKKEDYELDLISGYLPVQMSEEEIREKLEDIIKINNIPKETSSMGKLMPLAKDTFKNDADPSAVARIASSLLKGE